MLVLVLGIQTNSGSTFIKQINMTFFITQNKTKITVSTLWSLSDSSKNSFSVITELNLSHSMKNSLETRKSQMTSVLSSIIWYTEYVEDS